MFQSQMHMVLLSGENGTRNRKNKVLGSVLSPTRHDLEQTGDLWLTWVLCTLLSELPEGLGSPCILAEEFSILNIQALSSKLVPNPGALYIRFVTSDKQLDCFKLWLSQRAKWGCGRWNCSQFFKPSIFHVIIQCIHVHRSRFSYPTDVGLGHVTCLGQWNVINLVRAEAVVCFQGLVWFLHPMIHH